MNLRLLSSLAILSSLAACGGSGKPNLAGKTQPILDNYASNLYAMYSDAVDDETAFAAKLETFLATPNETNLTAARQGWIDSRAHYMLSEGARFYNGPIDIDPPNHEASINSWPLDEAYVDYSTDGTGVINDTMGLINNPSALATADITVAGIDMLNAQGGDRNISDGYHAIEFLLWGQALVPVGPGTRPATDYQTGGPRPNVDRRTAYIRAATQGVLEHLTAVRDQWAPGAAYRTKFVAGGGDSVALLLTGFGRMSKGELSGQRINAPYATKARRDQHDCFSSLTLTDYTRDAQGLQILYLGVYGTHGSAALGISSLVAEFDAATDTRLQSQLQTSVTDMMAIPPPFEMAISGDDAAPGRTAIRAVVASLRAQADMFADAATALGLSIQVPDDN